jgi:hypothetical protein
MFGYVGTANELIFQYCQIYYYMMPLLFAIVWRGMFKLDRQGEINGLAPLEDVAALGLFLLLDVLDIDVPPH